MAGIMDKAQGSQQPASTPESSPEERGLPGAHEEREMAMGAGDSTDPFEPVADDPAVQEAIDRIVGAGSLVIYSDKGSQSIVESLKSGAKDPGEAVARQAFSLMLSLDEKSKGTLPEDAIIPAASKLLTLVAELGEKSGAIQKSPNTIPSARQHLVALAIENGIIDPAEIQELMSGMDPAELEALVAEQDAIANGGSQKKSTGIRRYMAGGDPGTPPPQEGPAT